MNKHAYVFAGQGAQFPGMGKNLYESEKQVKRLFDIAQDILGFNISEVMFYGSEEDLKATSVTQPALFIHSISQIVAMEGTFSADGVAGHSLGEFSALVAAGILSFEDGLDLVNVRAQAMQEACDQTQGTMAAVLGLDDLKIEEICQSIDDIVVTANYNCPGQLVISGSLTGVEKASQACKEAGARRTLLLAVGGAFHSPLMESAGEKLSAKIDQLPFYEPSCPVYQNFTAQPSIDTGIIKENLIAQLTGPVRWTQTIQNMATDGFTLFTEAGGTGKILSGLIKKIDPNLETTGI
ncbi:MAG TPA: ACP S-malonyltransferase [Saprospiraceae bacterium]|nr:ACP S-malonyltransferase [Saprospiraceae bacterium]